MRLTIRRLAAALGLVALVTGLLVSVPAPAQAVTGSEFDPGYIISDESFYNGAAMSESEIQSFLERQVGSCANWNCLARYTENTPTRTWSFGTCSTYNGAAAESAARIIFKVQQACNLSAKVILVTLQKEQSLVTNPAPSDAVMRKAMGYGCPDTATCDSTYYGFFNQVFAAGRQLTWYTNPAGSFTSIRVGEVNAIRYHPDAACGAKNVLVRNKATAALYYYTPYTPNAAALANLRGTGDGCSAYGNRNFWVFFNDWFGSPTGDTARSNPIGNIELVEAKPGAFRVSGWTLDPDNTDSLSIHIYVGSVSSAYPANLPRDDVAAAYGKGRNHGFDVTVPAQGGGDTAICIYAINSGPGANVLLGCHTRTAKSGSPVGALADVRTTASGIEAVGWALDPDTTSATAIHVYVDSTSSAYTAGSPSTLIPAAYAEYGPNHGFNQPVAASPGAHTVCVYAINSGPGWHVELGCRQVVVPGGSGIPELGRAPIGVLEMVRGGTGEVEVSGWAIDPDTASPIPVHIYADSVGVAITADGERADVAAVYPAYGAKHGFSHRMSAAAGLRTVCAYAINTGSGGHTQLGCKTVDVLIPTTERGRAPIGYLEGVSVDATGVNASGWAIDPDTAQPIQVHVYVDAVGVATTASVERRDIANAYPGYGALHGFGVRVNAAPGPHTVCAYGIDSGPGAPSVVGCRQIVIPGGTSPDLGRAPIGALEAAVARSGAVDVSGWALDPDTSESISVHVYVDSVGVAILADQERADVAAHYPAYGTRHGYGTTMSTTPGSHTVCAYGINTGAGGHSLLGCRTLVVP